MGVSGRRNRHRHSAIDTEVAAVPARNPIARFLPVAAIAAGLLVAAPAADAKGTASAKPVIATIAVGDKRVNKPKAKTAQAVMPCQNTDVLPTAENLDLVRAAILCLHNQVRAQNELPLLKG